MGVGLVWSPVRSDLIYIKRERERDRCRSEGGREGGNNLLNRERFPHLYQKMAARGNTAGRGGKKNTRG